MLFSSFLLFISLVKLPSLDDILNMFWVDVVPIYPTIESSIVSITNAPNVDKYEHAFFYAFLAFLLWIDLPKKYRYYKYLITFAYCFILGSTIEILQGFTSFRTTNIMDACANMVGTIIALILIFLISYWYERKRKNLSNCLNAIKRCRVQKRPKNS